MTTEKETNTVEEIVLPHTLTLKDTFEYAGEEVTQIVFQNRLTCAMTDHIDMSKFTENKLTLKDLIPVVSKMTGELPQVISSLGFADGMRAVGVVAHFLGDGE